MAKPPPTVLWLSPTSSALLLTRMHLVLTPSVHSPAAILAPCRRHRSTILGSSLCQAHCFSSYSSLLVPEAQMNEEVILIVRTWLSFPSRLAPKTKTTKGFHLVPFTQFLEQLSFCRHIINFLLISQSILIIWDSLFTNLLTDYILFVISKSIQRFYGRSSTWKEW